MTNKPTKKKRPDKKPSTISPAYDSTREQNVLLIDMHKDIKTIAEGHSDLGRKLDQVNTKLDDHSKRLDKIELEIVGLKTATAENSQSIKKLAQGQERIEQKLDAVTLDHEQRLTKLEAVR
jgi:predicted  nucleic acid-binding Zn-ribbon protein